MTLFWPDYTVLIVAAAFGIVAMFSGFSGAFAMLLGSIAGGAAVKFGWPITGEYLVVPWQR